MPPQTTASPAALSAALPMLDPSTPASPRVDPPMDSLQLPLPPTTLTFQFPSKSHRAQAFRYNRAGSRSDAQRAVIGKGGFGTVYRFERDDSFTPPESFEGHLPGSSSTVLSSDDPDGSPNGHASLPQVTLTPTAGKVPDRGHHAPAVIIVKVCRTPSTGSFDEMPKTGLGRAVAKAADAALSQGDASGFHTRVVRGEARLLRFLQMMARREGRGDTPTSVVRLLADLPIRTGVDGSTVVDQSELPPEEHSGPVPRLLLFERMVDLDAVMTPDGWSKKHRQWTHNEVEEVARDIAAGLSFLHRNHIVHGDLKPSNVMRDAKTGAAKIIDLGASRRFVCVPNQYKESTTAVEELDQFIEDGIVPPQTAHMIHSEGLGSLTGSPYFMAPEVLLQAGRYLDRQGLSRSILHDYVNCQALLPATIDRAVFAMAFEDFKRGWGIKADIWSWACSVLALLLKTLEPEQKRSSSTICPFTFSLDDVDTADILEPRHRLHRSERKLPRFHEWARLYPITIVKTVTQGIALPAEASGLSSAALGMLAMSFQHMDQRPTATTIHKALHSVARDPAARPSNWSKQPERRVSLTPSVTSEAESVISHVGSAHNVDVGQSPASGSPYMSGLQRASYSECSALQPYPRLGAHAQAMSSSSSLSVAQESMSSSPAVGMQPLPETASKPPDDTDMMDAEGNEDAVMEDVLTAPISVGPKENAEGMDVDEVSGALHDADGAGGSGFLDKTRSKIMSFLPRRNTVTNRPDDLAGRSRGQTITARNFQADQGSTSVVSQGQDDGAPSALPDFTTSQPGSNASQTELAKVSASMPQTPSVPSHGDQDHPSTANPIPQKRRRSILGLSSMTKRMSQTFSNQLNNSNHSNNSGTVRGMPNFNPPSDGGPSSPGSQSKTPQRSGTSQTSGDDQSSAPKLGERMKRKSLVRLRNTGFKPKE